PVPAVDGKGVVAVWGGAAEAVRRARAGEGPTLIECKTYRTRAHAEGMGDFGYRTREDVEQWKTRCPIRSLRERLTSQGIKAADLDAIDAEITALVNEAQQAAESDPWPDAATAADHVYAGPGEPGALAPG